MELMLRLNLLAHLLTCKQEVDETPDYTDSDTNANTTASSVVGEPLGDGRRKRSEANQLRRSIFGKKHDRLGESKVCKAQTTHHFELRIILCMLNNIRK